MLDDAKHRTWCLASRIPRQYVWVAGTSTSRRLCELDVLRCPNNTHAYPTWPILVHALLLSGRGHPHEDRAYGGAAGPSSGSFAGNRMMAHFCISAWVFPHARLFARMPPFTLPTKYSIRHLVYILYIYICIYYTYICVCVIHGRATVYIEVPNILLNAARNPRCLLRGRL